MKKKNSNLTIRLAKKKDLNNILLFLRINWNSNHIYLRRPEFFKYELGNRKPQFVLAIINNSIVGLVGFYHYEKNIHNSDLFLVLLRVLEKFSNHQIAVKIIMFCKSLTSKNIHTVGANKNVLPLFSLLKFNTGWLDHFYWINPCIRKYSICKVDQKTRLLFSNKNIKNNKYEFNRITKKKFKKNIYDKLSKINYVRKSYWYFKKRYIDHPIYQYDIYSLNDRKKNSVKGLGIFRVVNFKKSKCLKLIDWVGELKFFKYFCIFSCHYARKINAEFVDLYCSGILQNDIEKSGFIKIYDNNIIPNYFSPFQLKNIPISYFSSDSKNLIFFRGDCDQDRPS